MNIIPTSQAGGRLSSKNMAATQRMGDKDLYLEMMNELMEVTTTATTATTTREDRITMDIAGPDDQFRRRRYKDERIQPSSTTTNTTNTLQNFFDREKHDRVRHQNSFASDEIYCEMEDDDDNNDDEDEFYEDDHDTVSSMLQHFKHQPSPFSPEEASLSKKNDCDMDAYDSMYLYHSPRKPNSVSSSSKPKYNRNRMNAKQMDMLSTSLHTSDGTEVTTTETDYSLNGSSHHSHATMMRSPHSQRRYYASVQVAELPTVIVYEGSGNDDATSQIDVDVPDIFSLQTHHLLGEGFFGRVYLVSAPSDGKNNSYYALKKISKYHLICEDQVHTVLREKKILQSCSHPNIATFYASKQDASSLYLLQSYIPGGDLFHLTHHYSCVDHNGCRTNYEYHPVLSEESNVQFYVACIADALWYLHCGFSNTSTANSNSNRSIVYRDLKPENVMINERGYPILIDFGYAKILETSLLHDDDEENVAVQSSSLTKTYTMCGTAKYISPEIIEGAGHTCSTDYWSLGIVVYELLTCGREHPFEYLSNMDDLSLYRSVVEADYIPLADEISVDGIDFVDQLLTKDLTLRLGATESRAYNPILMHPWLRNWDVSLLRQQSYRAPWIPTVKNSLDPTANHNPGDDSRNTEEELLLTFDMDQQIDPNLTMREQAKFAEF